MTFWGIDTFAAGLLFARVGALMMLMPGFGEAIIPARIRLAFALVLALLLAPVVGERLPSAPSDLGAAASLVAGETLIGVMLGAVGRMLMSGLATAGQIVGLETGLSFAQTTDPTQGQAGLVFGIFLNLMGAALIFATNLHHAMLGAVVASYEAFRPGAFPSLADAAALGVKAMGDAFRIGLQIAAPLLLAGLVYRVGLGILSRLIPQIQVFFVTMPLNVLGGFILFAMGLSGGMLVWLDRLDRYAATLQ